MRKFLSKIKNRISRIGQVENFKSGHYYSAVPLLKDINNRSSEVFNKRDPLLGINIKRDNIVDSLKSFSSLSEEVPFYSIEKKIRFNIENHSFSYDDAPILHYMLRTIKPKRIIEIGCGNSSAVMLDTDEIYLEDNIDFTFIDIDCTNLKLILKEKDLSKVKIIEKPIQIVDIEIFKRLKANDLLFIDSSHVSKIGSDLNTIIFNILPVLNEGVFIHFHDIRFPFQYEKELVNSKVFWNEAYLLRSFLMFNEHFEIFFWLNYLLNLEDSSLLQHFKKLPLDRWNRRFNNCKGIYTGAGGSIYLKKVK